MSAFFVFMIAVIVQLFKTLYIFMFTNHSDTQHTGSNMNGTPYTLRASLLTQAQEILTHKYHQEYEKIRYLCDRDAVDLKVTVWPTPPSTEDIVLEAEKLYKFVQTK